MTDSPKAEAKSTPFFTTLRRLARQVDNGVKDVTQKLDMQLGHGQDTHHITCKLLLDMQKEMEALKKNARSSLADMRKKGGDFDRTHQLCGEVADQWMNRLLAIQKYLCQYGYMPSHGKGCESKADGEIESENSDPVEHSDSPAKENKISAMNLSPRLEDYGVSSYTLNLMHCPLVPNNDFKVPNGVPVNNYRHCQKKGSSFPVLILSNGCEKQLDFVPTPFLTKGLTVTPSLFSSQYRSEANKGAAPSRPEQPGLAKVLDFTDSPVPPVLHTPGMKQIPQMKDFLALAQKENEQRLSSPVPPVFLTPGMKQIPTKAEMEKGEAAGRKVAKQLKFGDDPTATDSPIPPLLKTPGIKQISKGPASPEGEGRGFKDELEVPKTPELTFSLKDLEEMTMSFRNTSLTTTFSEKMATLSSDLNDAKIPLSTDCGARSQHLQFNQHKPVLSVTSRQHDLTGFRPMQHCNNFASLSKHELPAEPPFPNLRTNRFGFTVDPTELGIMPDTPELQMVSLTENSTSPPSVQHFGQGRAVRSQAEKSLNADFRDSTKPAYFSKDGRSGSCEPGSSLVGGYFMQQRFSVKDASCIVGKMEPDTGHSRCGFRPFVKTSEQLVTEYDPRSGEYSNKENLQTPLTPELTFPKLGANVISASGEPRFTQPLTDSNLDLPPTPKFMGNYHFLKSK